VNVVMLPPSAPLAAARPARIVAVSDTEATVEFEAIGAVVVSTHGFEG
jgi:hypothetical protein